MADAPANIAHEAREVELRRHAMLKHPHRYAIFMILGERLASAVDLAPMLGTSRKLASEHLKKLEEAGLVEFVRTESGQRGGLKSLYRSVDRLTFNADEWEALSPEAKTTASAAAVRLLHGQVDRALRSGTFDSIPERVHIRRPLWGDRQAAKEIDAIFCRADRAVEEVERKSLGRNHSDEPPIKIITAQQSFEAAPEDR